MKKEKELLRKQMELLAEQSAKGYPDELEGLTKAMCEVNRELATNRLLFGAVLFSVPVFYFLVSIFVHVKKLLRGDA